MAAGRMTRSAAAAALTVWGFLTAEAVIAQNPQALFPPNVILPNNNSLPIGEVGGLEANAYTARASDPTSLWFNPAGIAGTNVSAVSAKMFQRPTIPNTAAVIVHLSNKGRRMRAPNDLEAPGVHHLSKKQAEKSVANATIVLEV